MPVTGQVLHGLTAGSAGIIALLALTLSPAEAGSHPAASPSHSAGHELPVAGIATISGRVTDNAGIPLGDIQVYATPLDHECLVCVADQTDVSGEYTLTVEPGDYWVFMYGGNYRGEWWNSSGGNVGYQETVVVGLDENIRLSDVQLSRYGMVTGTVRDSQGSPVPDATVTATGPVCCSQETVTDADGHYTMIALAPGAYIIGAGAAGYETAYWTSTGSVPSAAQAEPVSSQLDTVLSGIDVNLNPKGSISGRLTDSVGSPVVPFAGVVASRNNFECCEYWYAPTDDTGAYKIVDLQTGDYKLRGGGPPDQYALVYYTASGGSPDINQAEAVPVVYGLDTSVAEFHLLRLGSISGRVTDMVGAPIVGAEVRANFPQCGGCTPPSVLTDTGGNYRIDGLQPMDYLVGASAWGYVSQFFGNAGGAIAPEDATLIYPNLEEDVTGIDFRLPRPARVEGRVLDVAGDPVQGATVAISIAGCPGCGGGASTDANGEYIFWSFPPGDITLYAYKSGYYTAMYWTSDGGDQWQPEIIHVADGAQLTGYDFTLRMPGYVQERDVNCDGDVDAVDALRILRHVAGLYPNEPPGCPLIDSGNPVQGDVNCDKIADAVDALGILRYVAGLSTGFPLGCPPPKS